MRATATMPAELFFEVAGVDHSVKVERRVIDGEWNFFTVTVSRHADGLNYYQFVFSETMDGCASEIEAVRWAFRRQRENMNEWLRSWDSHRIAARNERGGKRAYYTKHANGALKFALQYADKWRLAKLLWKGITKL